MHLLIPFAAALSDEGQEALARVGLPHLSRLATTWTEVGCDSGEEASLSPPHERVLAASWGWPVSDGLLPFAACAAASDGIDVAADDSGWALLSPTHWQASTDRVALTDPDALALDEISSRAVFAALEPLFAEADWALCWGSASRWYTRHRSLATLPTASLDRVAGRHVGRWLNRGAESRGLHRVQVQAQMTLHTHPANAEREARGLPPVNSVWASGTGVTRPIDAALRQSIRVDSSLRAAALAEDWPAWSAAWQRLDAGVIHALLESATASTRLTLCGERSALTLAPRRRPLWRRWFGPHGAEVAALLGRL